MAYKNSSMEFISRVELRETSGIRYESSLFQPRTSALSRAATTTVTQRMPSAGRLISRLDNFLFGFNCLFGERSNKYVIIIVNSVPYLCTPPGVVVT